MDTIKSSLACCEINLKEIHWTPIACNTRMQRDNFPGKQSRSQQSQTKTEGIFCTLKMMAENMISRNVNLIQMTIKIQLTDFI